MAGNAVVTGWPSGSTNAGWPATPTAMLMPGRVQGWPAGSQRAANRAEQLLSQAVAYWDVAQYRDGNRFLRNQGTGGELLDLRLGSSIVANSNDPLFLAPERLGYVYLPGVAGNYLSAPDEDALDITGDIDIRVRVALDDWTPAADTTLLSKYAAAGSRSFMLQVLTTGVLQMRVSTDGTAIVSTSSTVATGLVDGNVKWVRVTVDVDNGAAGNDMKYYLSDDNVTWTQLGSTVTTAGTTSIFASSTPVQVGTFNSATNPATGKVYRAQVLNGIDGTTVLDIDCDAITSGSATSFTAVTNQTVTVNRSTSGRKSVCVPSRANKGAPLMLLGTDDYMEVLDNWQHGLLNFDQGQSFTVVAVVRVFGTSVFGVYKAGGQTGSTTGWVMYGSSRRVRDGVTTVAPTVTFTSAEVTSAGMVVNRAAKTISAYNNTVTPVTSDISGVGSLANLNALRIGGTGNTSDNEFYAAAIFRRTLSADEITRISNYFTARIA